MIKNSSTASCVAAFLTFGLISSVGFEENPVSSLPSIVVIFVISTESLVDFKSAPLSEELFFYNKNAWSKFTLVKLGLTYKHNWSNFIWNNG